MKNGLNATRSKEVVQSRHTLLAHGSAPLSMDDPAATKPTPPPWAFRLAAAAVGTGVAAGVGYAAWRAWDRRRVPRLAATPAADIHEGRWYQLPPQGRLHTSASQTKELFVSFHDPDTNKPLDSCAGIVAGLEKEQKRRALELAEEGRSSRSSSNSRIGSRDGGKDESSLGELSGLEGETRAYEPEMLYLHPGPLDPQLYSNPEGTPEGAEAIRRKYHSDIWCDAKFPPSEASLGKRGDSGTDEFNDWERHKRKVIRWVPLRRLMHQVRGDVVG